MEILIKSYRIFHLKVSYSHQLIHSRYLTLSLVRTISQEEFETNTSYIINSQLPVLIKNYASNWPAVNDNNRKWNNLSNFHKRVRGYSVPLEIGGDYMQIVSASQSLESDTISNKPSLQEIDFGSFIDYIYTNNHDDNTHLYVAQKDIQDIPPLLDDIIKPSFIQDRNLYGTNIWFSGHAGSSSPNHFDPYENMLCQVFGSKKCILFSPKESKHLYQAHGTSQKNTSTVDNFIQIDYKRYPLLRNVQGYECELQAGDALYIPLKWWHYCKSHSMNCSINFWFLK